VERWSNELAFIVDRHQEKLVLQRLCAGVPVRMTNLNGKDVELKVIAKSVASYVKLLKGRHFPIFVIVDREKRRIESLDMEAEIAEELKELGIDGSQLVVSSPDRMIENWIIAGNPNCGDGAPLFSDLPANSDGYSGKVVVRNVLRARNLSYDETGNGVEFFCKMDLKRAAERSVSFARLYEQLKPYCIRLRYIDQQDCTIC
jgi:hypothetical protein